MTDRNWRGELAEAMGVDPAVSAPGPVPGPAPAPAADGGRPREGTDRPGPEVEARLARIERLLDADLELLGGAVVAQSAEGLAQQLTDVHAHLEAAVRQMEAQQPSPAITAEIATLTATSAELFEISRRLLRRTDVLDKQLAALESANAAMLQRLEVVGGVVSQLLERLDS